MDRSLGTTSSTLRLSLSLLLQFLGSEESILEYEPDRNARGSNPAGQTAVSLVQESVQIPAPVSSSALGDLIRSRDFVIDFPRVYVLNSGSVVGARETLFPVRLPERSQSSLSLRSQARDWMSQMSNKLEEQQGLRRLRKEEMQQVSTCDMCPILSNRKLNSSNC